MFSKSFFSLVDHHLNLNSIISYFHGIYCDYTYGETHTYISSGEINFITDNEIASFQKQKKSCFSCSTRWFSLVHDNSRMCYARTQQFQIKKVCIKCGWEVETEREKAARQKQLSLKAKEKCKGIRKKKP